MKSNVALLSGGWRRGHQLANGFENDPEVFVIFLFQFLELAGQVLMSRKNLAQAHEGAHDGDIDVNGALTAKHAGKHGNALFGESVREIAAPAATRTL